MRAVRQWAAEGPSSLPGERFLGGVGEPFSEAQAWLGRELFFDPDLSAEGDRSCGSCHRPQWGFGNGRCGPRRVPGFLGIAYRHPYAQAGGWARLRARIDRAWESTTELDADREAAIERLRARDEYRQRFEQVFARKRFGRDEILAALAAFIALCREGETPYDRFLAGDAGALEEDQRRGLAVFQGPGGCAQCHPPPLFTDERTHLLGTDGERTTPSLRRDLEAAAPYLHDGSCRTLSELLRKHPSTDLSSAQREDLGAFLRSLRGELSPLIAR